MHNTYLACRGSSTAKDKNKTGKDPGETKKAQGLKISLINQGKLFTFIKVLTDVTMKARGDPCAFNF